MSYYLFIALFPYNLFLAKIGLLSAYIERQPANKEISPVSIELSSMYKVIAPRCIEHYPGL